MEETAKEYTSALQKCFKDLPLAEFVDQVESLRDRKSEAEVLGRLAHEPVTMELCKKIFALTERLSDSARNDALDQALTHRRHDELQRIASKIGVHDKEIESLRESAVNLRRDSYGPPPQTVQPQQLQVRSALASLNSAYLVALAIIVVVVIFAIVAGGTEKPDVSIAFNVGEIIGGILAGAGIAAAGGAYAIKTLGERRE